MTGADRQWAAQYEEGDLVRYTRGSKVLGIDPGEYASVDRVDARENRIIIERENGAQQTYDPRRLSGVAVYQEVQREFSQGDRVQWTTPSRELQVANRELGTIKPVSNTGNLEIRMDSGREVRFHIREHPHLDHGYAVTSHSSQGQTSRESSQRTATEVEQQPTAPKTETVSIRGAGPPEDEQGHSLGIGIA